MSSIHRQAPQSEEQPLTNRVKQVTHRPTIHFQTKDQPYQAEKAYPTTRVPFRRKSTSSRWFKNHSQSRLNKGLWALLVLIFFFFVILVIPSFLAHRTVPSNKQTIGQNPPVGDKPDMPQVNPDNAVPVAGESQGIMIPVYLTKQKEIETVTLEDYVRGVVAAEMPLEYEMEALKAQALAARTYIIRRMAEHDRTQVPVPEALVTDTTTHQVYYNRAQLESILGDGGSAASKSRIDKLNQAVNETKDQILTYDGKPINATFFSTSGGYTENSEDVWPFASPYLRSVMSPWDATSPRYKEVITLSTTEAARKLGVKTISTSDSSRNGIRIIERTAGHRIKTITIGGKIFTGSEVRAKLGLKSAQFDWQFKGNSLLLTTYGYGHGVGMSQWGANEMAKKGQSASDIVRYYYQGIAITKASNILN
ncbi:stage II sporulation protein D [Paenibacillus sp. KN14-4R]|uniref:stage II sporulation protein D n=1 Tax=Paenibacillus sp. KN14-4R TaxID=3445773 RepID=UPI003FA0ABE7